ncbi:ARM repeat-containing protein [Basidiobolus meristosporus CBS 931.73]|uniref:non-specific serine/threonine protein kinase n=1 Tax=Basidiobolus meristosporus CBS 931.73 TaxID=1314790 RepID=A0A1Y1YME5_9FUNG|nr:ARM repeat-containing protein [Basidiobolus meristosporus CBS 931.73]|eukprot:ORX99187.1 ARM repeat-containing protein [Basidiobolus meristosporus CBS 931.73]
MGNNFSSTIPSTATAGIDNYVGEIGDIQYEKSLGSARFMKTIRGRHKEGPVVVKIFIKPYVGLSLDPYINQLRAEREKLLELPNAFPYQRILETETAVYLIRQYFFSNLYDRISTRPFLDLIEKKWIAYQLLRTVADAHRHEIFHGDIKTENVLVTSWNWVLLSDYASFKPTYLPEDNPADFSFFFDTSSRRSCYLAPERFYNFGGEDAIANGSLTPAMDVFALGCVIAELFLEGSPIFSFSQLLSYKRSEYDPLPELERIEDPDIRSLIQHMIQLDPTQRFTAERYLAEWRGKAFPQYFYSFLHQYLETVLESHSTIMSTTSDGFPNDADLRIERVYHDFDKIAYFLGFYDAQANQEMDLEHLPSGRARGRYQIRKVNSFLPTKYSIPNYDSASVYSENLALGQDDNGAVIFLSLICASMRNAMYPYSKLYALDMLLAISEHLSEEMKLDRVLPYIVSLLADNISLVRGIAIRALTKLLSTVESVSPINSKIFQEYVFPHLSKLVDDSEVFVRATYAACIPSLAETALRFLELSQRFSSENGPLVEADSELEDSYEPTYDRALQDLQMLVQEQVTMLLIDVESSVNRALLTGMTKLCIFFGRQKTNDFLLSHMITYLNEPDSSLRSGFFEAVVGVCKFLGSRCLEEYILPLMIQALTDPEEYVIVNVLNSISSLAEEGLLGKEKTREIVSALMPLIYHPNVWVRYGVIRVIVSGSNAMAITDVWCFIYPIIQPYLKADILDFTEEELIESVRPAIAREVFDEVLLWANESSGFLKLKNLAVDGGDSEDGIVRLSIGLDDTDKSHFAKLLNLNIDMEDLRKLVMMRAYLSKLSRVKQSARAKSTENLRSAAADGSDTILLKNLGVTPRTVFLSSLHPETPPSRPEILKRPPRPHLVPEDTARKLSITLTNRSHLIPDIQLARTPSETSLESAFNSSRGGHEYHRPLSSAPRNVTQHRKHDLSNLYLRNQSETSLHSVSILSTSISRSNSHRLSLPSSPASKAMPATSTTIDNAIATLEVPSSSYEENSSKSLAVEARANAKKLAHESDFEPVPITPTSVSSYTWRQDGPGRTLKPLLQKKSLEAFPRPLSEFGSPIPSKRLTRNRMVFPRDCSGSRATRALEGVLISNLTEHKGGVNQISFSPDDRFFATCSDDGSIRIWDASRFEKNATTKSRVTYQQGGKVKCMAFIENTYSLAAGSDNGSIHIIKVNYQNYGNTPKYGKCRLVRKIHLKGEYPLHIDHMDFEQSSLLIYATNLGKIYGYDLRQVQIVWVLQNPINYGVITAMLCDPKRTWLLIGTNRGILTLWDMRFHILLRSWQHPSKLPIQRLRMFMGPMGVSRTSRYVLIVAGKNEVSLWDIEKLECKEVFMVRSMDDKRLMGPMLESFQVC